MADEERPSLAEWLVLCLIREEPTYGLVLAGLLSRDGCMGQVWSVPKAQVYRALPRLEALGLIQTVGEQRTSQGPVRSLYQATPAGQAAARAWLSTPAGHARDIRSELMVKLALLDRSGIDSRDCGRRSWPGCGPSPPPSANDAGPPPDSSTPWSCGGTRR
jgi:PadR family transcriptional regulator AphA